MDVNFNANFLNQLLNSKFASNKQIKPLIKVLNKYGIYGVNCMSFLFDLAAAAQEMQDIKQGEAQ